MGYYSIYRIFKDLFFTILKLIKKSSFRIITIIIIIFLTMLLFFSNYSKADYISDNLNPYDNILNNNTVIQNIYNYYETHWNYTGLSVFHASNDYMSIFFDYTCFKQYVSNGSIYLKNISSNVTSGISVDFFNPDGSFKSHYSTIWSHPNDVTNLQTTSLFAYSDIPVFESISSETIWYPEGYITLPYITNTSTEITSWDFNYLNIDGGTISPYFELNQQYYPFSISLLASYNGTAYTLDITDYTTINETAKTFSCSIPRLAISSLFNFNLNSSLSFTLLLTPFDENGDLTTPTSYSLDTYNFTLGQTDIDTINNDGLRYKITENSNVINNINNSLENSSVNSSSIDSFNNIGSGLGITDNTNISNIFSRIYTAFTTKYNDNNIGYGYTLSIPIPFANRTLDISPHTVFGRSWSDLYQPENEYSSPAVQTIYRFIQPIWWFLIGMFILKDIRTMINKVAEGNIDNVSSDIEKELL